MNSRIRSLTATIERLRQKDHLPQDLVFLLSQTSQFQLNEPGPVDFEQMFGGLPLDMGHARNLCMDVLEWIRSNTDQIPEPTVQGAERILKAFETEKLDFSDLVTEIFQEPGGILDRWSREDAAVLPVFQFLVRASVAPSFRQGMTLLHEKEAKAADRIHGDGTCPICGHPPYMLELRGKEGFRFAHCSLCHFEYRVARTTCVSCGNTDAKKMKYFTAEQEPGFRVETCDACKTYIKTIDFREAGYAAFAQLNDLESLALDFAAAEQGYTRVGPSVWGI